MRTGAATEYGSKGCEQSTQVAAGAKRAALLTLQDACWGKESCRVPSLPAPESSALASSVCLAAAATLAAGGGVGWWVWWAMIISDDVTVECDRL